MTLTKRGRIDDHTLNIPVEFPHPVEDVWNFVTTSDTLVTFYGSFAGNPAEKKVTLTMVEAPDNPGEAIINHCVPNELLDVTLTDPAGAPWSLIMKFRTVNDNETALEFIQDIAGFEDMAADVGAGWEFYLDRWKLAMAGEDVGQVQWSEYSGLAEQYQPEVPKKS